MEKKIKIFNHCLLKIINTFISNIFIFPQTQDIYTMTYDRFFIFNFAKLHAITAIPGNTVECRRWTVMVVLKKRVQDI